jgi:hypothetical protein
MLLHAYISPAGWQAPTVSVYTHDPDTILLQVNGDRSASLHCSLRHTSCSVLSSNDTMHPSDPSHVPSAGNVKQIAVVFVLDVTVAVIVVLETVVDVSVREVVVGRLS